jgi:hypothetical protein
LAEIHLKTVERAQLNFRHNFGRISSKLEEIRPMVGFFCADLGEIRPVWKKIGQLGRYSTKIGGGNSTARRFKTNFDQKNITVFELSIMEILTFLLENCSLSHRK